MANVGPPPIIQKVGGTVYRSVFRKTSTFVAFAVFAAFFFERGVDSLTDTIWDNYNKGKQWKDIKPE